VLGRPVSVNAAGFRGPLVSPERLPGVVRIGAFGDSHTFGSGAPDDGAYPAVAERLLNARSSGGYVVLNCGVGGMEMFQIMHHARQYASRFDLEVVLFTFHQGDLLESASGDFIVDRKRGISAGSKLKQLVMPAYRYSALARFFIPRAAAFGRGVGAGSGLTEEELAAIQQNRPIWQQRSKELLQFATEMRREGRTVVVVLFPEMQNFARHPATELYRTLEAWCATNQLPCVNLLPGFTGQRAGALRASLMDSHPNERGYEIAGRQVAAFLETLPACAPRRQP